MGELFVRVLRIVPEFGTSRDLFISNGYGTSVGNARNVETVSYGAKVYTDNYGFRVPYNDSNYSRECRSAMLIMGDSVAFGLGVEEEKTFAGRLRTALPSVRIYNSSVIGHCIADYRNVIDQFLPEHSEIDRIFLILCLNDTSEISSDDIKKTLNPETQTRNWVEALRQVRIISKINTFLRIQSRLYILIKTLVTDTHYRYWRDCYFLYEKGNEQQFGENMNVIRDINREIKAKGITFTVFIVPFEYQLRVHDSSTNMPQEKIGRFFRENDIDYVDAVQGFRNLGGFSRSMFLYGDPMHFSEKGHEVMYKIVMRKLTMLQSPNW
jgi:lysophospholipase L1-like esterase